MTPEESAHVRTLGKTIADLIVERDAALAALHAAEAKVRELTRQPDAGDLATSLARSEAAMQEAFLKRALQGHDPDAYMLVQQMDWSLGEHRTWLEPRK